MSENSANNISPRVGRLRSKCISAIPEMCVERARLITESYRETESLPVAIKRAKALENILAKTSIFIYPDELIVGNHSGKLRAGPVFPEFDVGYIEKEIDEFPTRKGDPFLVAPEVREEVLEICKYWKGKTVKERVLAMLPDETRMAGEDGVAAIDSAWTLQNGDGHLAPDYPTVLNRGLESIIGQAKAHLAKLDLSDPEDLKKSYFLKSVIIANTAVIGWARRYSELAGRLASQEGDPQRKRELKAISRICQRVPEKPATTFYEVIQSLLFVQLAIQLETNGHSISIGRFDQFMYPFYRRDIEEGRMIPEQALELLQCLWIKLSSLTKLRPTVEANLNAGYPMFQNMVVGGQTPDGKDATNELSYLCLKATETMKLVQPNFSVRYHKKATSEFLMACAKLIRLGTGFPAMFNDEIIIPALLNRGVAIEDAYDYCLVGCVEPSVQGKWGGRYGASQVNLTKMLELALHQGRDLRTGIQLYPGKGDLSTFNNFDEIMQAYRDQVTFYTRQRIIRDNIQDLAWEELTPTPLLSSLVKDCIERGKDVKEGGAIYDYTGGQTGNIANVANSLAAIKKLVFEDKLISGQQLKRSLETNFEGVQGEKIRQLLINKAPKYGNDDAYVDSIAKKAFRIYLTEPSKYKNTRFGRGPLGCRFHPSTASVAANVPFGLVTGATPDGRKAWTPLADVESPFRGTDTGGPTAVIKSAAKLDHILLSGGAILNLKFSPGQFNNQSSLMNLVALIRTYFDLKGMEIQFNVVSVAALKDAQRDPERYSDLLVRVAGYSAYFVTLDPAVQEDIIARTEHRL